MSQLKLVVFDMDGTLIDSQDMIVESMRQAFSAMNIPAPTRADVLSIVGLSLFEAISCLAPDLSADQLEAATEGYKQAFINLRKTRGGEASAPLYPGARACLEALASMDNMLLGVATGKARRGLDHAYAAHDLSKFFVTSQTADNHPSKPHPSMLHSALAETGVDAASAVMVGDTSFDMEMGRAAGFKTIGVSWGYHRRETLISSGADVIIDHFDNLIAALNHLEGLK